MSNHETDRSKAVEDALSTEEDARLTILLREQSADLRQHPDVVRGLFMTPGKVGQALASLIPSQDPYAEARRQWEAFYLKFFGVALDFSKVAIPKQSDGFSRLVIVAQGVTLNAAMAACKKHFRAWSYHDDLDKDVVHNDRSAANGAYAVWFRDRIEADEELANKSANDLAAEGVKSITLLERILMELEYFGRTGHHLDINNWTLCAGSRYTGGSVPHCYWGDGKFVVGWASVGARGANLRSRVAVS